MAGRDEELRLRLFGQDVTASRVLDEVRRAADRAEDELNNLDPTVDTTQLRDLRDQLDRLNRRVAARVDVQIEPAGIRQELRDLRADLDWFDGRTANVQLRLTGAADASRQLADLSRDLMWFDSRDRIGIDIDVGIHDIDEVRELNDLLDRLHDRTINVRVNQSGSADVDDGGHLAALGGRAADAARSVTGLATSLAMLGAKGAAAITVVAQAGQWLAQMGPAAAVAAPALLTVAQAMGTVRLVSDEAGRQLEKFKPQLDAIKASAEQAFAPGFSKALQTFSSNFPVIEEGVRRTAGAFGWLANEAANVFSGPAFRADLGRIMNENATAVWRLGDAGVSLAGAFWDVAVAAQPVWMNLSSLIQVSAKHVALWIEAKRESGELATAIKAGADNIGAFVSAIWNFGVGLHSIFGAMTDDSTNLSEALFRVTGAFKDWATSEETVNRIKTAMDSLKAKADEVVAALGLGFITGVPQDSGWLGLIEHIGASMREVADFVSQDVLPTLASLADLLMGPFGQALLSVADILHRLVFDALSTLLAIVRDDIVPVFRDHVAPILNDDVIPAFRELANWVGDVLLPKVKDLADFLRDQLGPAFDRVKKAIDDNKPQLEALGKVLLDIATAIITVVVPAIEANFGTSIKVAGEVIGQLINIIGDLVEAFAEIALVLADVAIAVISAFKFMFDSAADTVAGIIGVFSLLPGPLGAPFREAKGVVEEFKRGVDTNLDAAVTKAREAAGAINGFMDGLHDKTVTVTVVTQQINKAAGMDRYDSMIPGNRWTGGPVWKGQLYKVGEKGEELFVPRTDGYILDNATTRGLQNGGGGGMAMGGGSVVYVTNHFHIAGSVVTERDLAERIAPRVRDAVVTGAGSNARRTGF